MSFFDRFRRKEVVLENIEPNTVRNVGIDDIVDVRSKYSQDWVELSPSKIRPTIKNRRKASRMPTVYGILNNLILKTISSFTIDGEDEDALKYILECDKDWNLKNLAYECLWKNFVDGECFYEYIIEDNHVSLRGLAFDGERYLIRKLYDDDAQLMGYMQWVIKDGKLPSDWKTRDYWSLIQDKSQVTITFEPDEISNPIFLEVDGMGESLVKNIVDIAYELESLNRMLPAIVYKSANVMVATVGNDYRFETKIDKKAREKIADDLSNYHKKGVVVLPYGVDVDVVGDNVLPKVEEYIKALKSQIYEGLITPESLYSSESSNRSTAEVQLTDSRTGHVLFIEFAQEFLKRWIERDIINKELELNGYPVDSVYIDFMTGDNDLDTNYLQKDDNQSNNNPNQDESEDEDMMEDEDALTD